MITNTYRDRYDISCDTCTHDDTIHAETWTELIAKMKEMKWKIRKEDEEWLHYCPECARLVP